MAAMVWWGGGKRREEEVNIVSGANKRCKAVLHEVLISC